MSTVIIIGGGGGGGGGGGQQQNKATGQTVVDGNTIVGENGEVVMYCQDAAEALRYLQRVVRDE